MTAIMTRMEKGERKKEEPQREHWRKRVARGCRLFLAEFSTTHFVWFDTNSLSQPNGYGGRTGKKPNKEVEGRQEVNQSRGTNNKMQ